jgi:hypothetical protein
MSELSKRVFESMVVSSASGITVLIITNQGMATGVFKSFLIYCAVMLIVPLYRKWVSKQEETGNGIQSKRDQNWKYT